MQPGAGTGAFGDLDEAAGRTDDRARVCRGVAGVWLRAVECDLKDVYFAVMAVSAVVLYTLREYIGAEAVNGALRRFLEKYRRTEPPYPTSLDLHCGTVKTQIAAARRLARESTR